MTRIIKTCDKCKKETDWLYDIPRYLVEGKNLNVTGIEQELCKECAQKLVKTINNFSKE